MSSWVIPDNLAVNGAGDAVLELQVHLWYSVLAENTGIGDITCAKLDSDSGCTWQTHE